MDTYDKSKVVIEMLNDITFTLNENLITLHRINNSLSPKMIILLSVYVRYNNWDETNIKIRKDMIDEIYKYSNDPFIIESIANDYLIQLLDDIYGKYKHINLHLDRYGFQLEFNTSIEYITKYIRYDDESKQFILIDNAENNVKTFFRK